MGHGRIIGEVGRERERQDIARCFFCDPKHSCCYLGHFKKKAYKCWEMKPNKQGGNLISLDTWIEHPQVEEILTNPDIIDEIIYFGDRFGGKEITLEEAIENSRNVDPKNKPESKLPGKRKAPDTPPTSGGSTSGTCTGLAPAGSAAACCLHAAISTSYTQRCGIGRASGRRR